MATRFEQDYDAVLALVDRTRPSDVAFKLNPSSAPLRSRPRTETGVFDDAGLQVGSRTPDVWAWVTQGADPNPDAGRIDVGGGVPRPSLWEVWFVAEAANGKLLYRAVDAFSVVMDEAITAGDAASYTWAPQPLTEDDKLQTLFVIEV